MAFGIRTFFGHSLGTLHVFAHAGSDAAEALAFIDYAQLALSQ